MRMNATNGRLRAWAPAVPCKIPDNIVSSKYTTAKVFVPSYEKYKYMYFFGRYLNMNNKREKSWEDEEREIIIVYKIITKIK